MTASTASRTATASSSAPFGWPGVPDHVSLWGLLIPIRRGFDQYCVDLRPCKLLPGSRTPLADRKPEDIDFYVVRENTEGEYSSVGGRMFPGTEREFVSQQSILTRIGTDRVMEIRLRAGDDPQAEEADQRHPVERHHLHHALFGRAFRRDGQALPGGADQPFPHRHPLRPFRPAPRFVRRRGRPDLFGDILSDLGPAVAGSIGIAASANINPEKVFPSMFEPVHGSAPDIAGKWVGQPDRPDLVRRHDAGASGEKAAADAIVNTMEAMLRDGGPRTRDMGRQAGTVDVGKALAEAIGRA